MGTELLADLFMWALRNQHLFCSGGFLAEGLGGRQAQPVPKDA